MARVHLVCVNDDVSRAERLAELFDAVGFDVVEGLDAADGGDVAVLVWSDACPESAGFMNTAQRHMDEGRAVIASFVAIADPTGIGAPVFDLSDWDEKNIDDPTLVPMLFAIEGLMAPMGSEVADADEGEDAEDALELVTVAPEPEPEPLRAIEIVERPAATVRVATPKPAKPRRERAPAPRRPMLRPQPQGRLRVALPMVAALCLGIVTVFGAAPFLSGGQGERMTAASERIALSAPSVSAPAAAALAAAALLTPPAFEALAPLPPPMPRIAFASAEPTAAPTPPRSRRAARTPRNITSWETPDPKRRGYLRSTGRETPAAETSAAPQRGAQVSEIAIQASDGRKRKPADAA